MHCSFRPGEFSYEFDDGDRIGLVIVPPGGVPIVNTLDGGLALPLCAPVKTLANGRVGWRHAEITAEPGQRYAWAWIADDSDRVLAVIDNARWVRPHPPTRNDVVVSTT
jgi:hypothetical protein